MFSMRTRIASVARNASGIDEASVGAVVERALEELHACVWLAFGSSDATNRASEAMRSRAHRVPLVRHRRRADLLALERLLDLAERLEHADVAAELRGARRDAGHDAQHLGVELARVCLARHGNRRGRSPIARHTMLLERAHLRVIAVEELEEARLRARRPLHAAEGQGARCGASRSARSSTRSCIQSVARLPTVVSCAGWRCV